ncbi:alpha/beta fold hydrolase [Natronorubrum thiooxidans]|uniref:Pimeloyl-ACP methyl ester carboxylesterase n=1 Tax=Natronorubrum thiooxidans TaxID=308853 RepID=A0A1N7GZY4_9EURY|nr:alpha/beta hydrolase [Natronorubrum thiooxidans]SIS18145.1 Pimeloyl-ACP methyl ester carboxylesterase [Natronorubrum thiooxidans]
MTNEPTLQEWTDAHEETTVSLDNHELTVSYYDEGETDTAETPLVFLHGIPTWSYLWRGVAPAFEADRRVIAPDFVGYGNSAMHDGFDRSIRAQERVLEELVTQLEVDQIDLVAHDIGGGVALRYAAHNPDAVETLVLSNSIAYDSWPIQFIVDLGLPGTINDMSVEDVDEQLTQMFQSTLIDPDDEFVEAMVSRFRSDEGRISLSRNAIATNTSHTTELDYSAITAETSFIWGENDGFQPIEFAEQLNDDLENTAGITRLDANHWVPEDRSTAFVEALSNVLE